MKSPTTVDISDVVAVVGDTFELLWSAPPCDGPQHDAVLAWARANGLDPRLIPDEQCWVVRLPDRARMIVFNEVIPAGPPRDDELVPEPAARNPDWSPVTRRVVRPLVTEPPVI